MSTISIRDHRVRVGDRNADMVPSIFTGGTFAVVPKIIVMHYTQGASARSSANWFRDPTNTYKSSAHVVIDRDGSLIQCVRLDTVAHHAGRSHLRDIVGLNRHSFGIELANWGALRQSSSGWRSVTGVSIADAVLAVHRNGNPDGWQPGPIGWEPFTEPQLATAAAFAHALVHTYGANEIVGHDDISRGRKWDPGPAFDMASFRGLVLEDSSVETSNLLRVAVTDGLNLRAGPGTQFEAFELLVSGTVVDPIETSGRWLNVTVLSANGTPRRTGWVHGSYLQAVT